MVDVNQKVKWKDLYPIANNDASLNYIMRMVEIGDVTREEGLLIAVKILAIEKADLFEKYVEAEKMRMPKHFLNFL